MSCVATSVDPVEAAKVAPANTAPTLVMDPRAVILFLALAAAEGVRLLLRLQQLLSLFPTLLTLFCLLWLLFLAFSDREETDPDFPP